MNLIFLIPTYGNSRENRKVIKAMDCMKGEKSLGLHYHGVNPCGSHHDSSYRWIVWSKKPNEKGRP